MTLKMLKSKIVKKIPLTSISKITNSYIYGETLIPRVTGYEILT